MKTIRHTIAIVLAFAVRPTLWASTNETESNKPAPQVEGQKYHHNPSHNKRKMLRGKKSRVIGNCAQRFQGV